MSKGEGVAAPKIRKLLPPGAGGQEPVFDAELLEGGLLFLLLLVRQSCVVGSQRPALLIFLRL